MPADLTRVADFLALVAGLFAAFAMPPSFWLSTSGTERETSAAAASFDFFELFAIYFSFTSASLYAQRKTAQAEIGMKKATANSIRP
ncbi:MAG: hypothetical protein ACREIF_10125 [Chthoniobacterales bacterium]